MPTRPYGAVITDYDLDGDNDLIVGCSAISSSDVDSIVIMFNDGWGNFELQGFEANSGIFIYCEDLSGDSYPDIISRDADSIFFHENDQQGGLGNEYKICYTIGNRRIGGIADMDTNGYKDIVYYGIQVIGGWGVAYNIDGYMFNDEYDYYTEDNEYITVGNLNDDDYEDVLVTNLSVPEVSYVMHNNIDTFQKEIISTRLWYSPYIIDINNDNQNEAVLEYLSSVHYINNWLFFFERESDDNYVLIDSSAIKGGSIIGAIDDFDQDGYQDLATTLSSWESDPSEDSVYVFRNNQNWGYELHESHYIGDWFYPSIISGDLNMDGFPDAVTIGYLNPNADYIQLLWNDKKGHFIDTNSIYVQQNEIEIKEQIIIYPNPSAGKITIRSSSILIKEVKIIDLSGRTLINKKMTTNQSSITLSLNSRQIVPGIYLCEIQMQNGTKFFRKILINQTS